MNKYYSLSPSNKKQFHDFLSPIFDAVRKNKIHSYFQLKNRQAISQNAKSLSKRKYIFQAKPKTANDSQLSQPFDLLANKTQLTYNGLYSPEQEIDKNNNSSQSSRDSGFNEVIQNIKEQPIDSRVNMFNKTAQNRMFRVNSKVKKHLVQQIDFEQIQKMFFKKRQTMTRYEYFLKVKNQSKNLQNKNNRKSSLSSRKKSKEKIIKGMVTTDEQISIPQPSTVDYELERSTFPIRSPQKRKFWIKEQKKRSINLSEFPDTVISGISYKTIQN